MSDMTPRERVEEQTRIRRALLANGYTPLANVSKKCMLKNWPRLVVDEDMIDDWSDRLGLLATGVRIEGNLVALDFDIDDAEALDAIWDALPDDLWALVRDMPVRRGGGEKVCLFCRSAGKTPIENIWSKAFYPPDVDVDSGEKPHRLEIFGAGGGGRQIGVYGAHTVEGGEVRVAYAWEGGRGLAEVALGDLPEVTARDLERLADVVSEVLTEMGWVYEVRALDGRVQATRAYVLTGSETFDVHGGANGIGLDALEAMAASADGVRVSMSWREGPAAANRTRGLVSINPADDRVQIWDSMTGVLYRPVSVDWSKKGQEISEKLAGLQLIKKDGSAARTSVLFPVVGLGGGGGGDGEGATAGGKFMVRVDSGRIAEAAREVMQTMAGFENVFDMGGRAVVVSDKYVITPLDDARMAQEIGDRFQCVKEVEKGRRVELVAVDAPAALVKQSLSVFREYDVRALRGITDMPVISASRLVVSGYDAGSRLLVSDGVGAAGYVPEEVDDEVARAALDSLWTPFREFPFVSDGDRGGVLACILTAVARMWLPTAPMFAFDAPVQGSGKSLLCRAIGALSGEVVVAAPLPLKDEDEVRKVLMSVLLAGPKAIVFDNQLGLLDSASLGGMLTSEVFSGRLLGTNTVLNAPTGVLVMVNGNNLAIGGDMPRRTVRVRIDPQMETPFERRFDFDPETLVKENRAELVAAALVLMRWGMAAARKGRVGSFERWDEVVGQTVALVGGRLDARFGDPADVIREAHADDPRRDELSDLLQALRDEFGNKWFTGSEVVARMAGASGPLFEAFGYDKMPSSKSVGRHLTFRRDAMVGGLRLCTSKDNRTKVHKFRVLADDDVIGVVVEGELERRRAEQKAKMGILGRP